jgi:outer membrane autotransporter protein
VALKSKNEPPIRVSDKFDYQRGSLVVAGPLTDDPEGTWKIIDGPVSDPDGLAKNTYLTVSGSNKATYAFGGLGEENVVEGVALYQGYLKDGSLDLVIEQKSKKDLSCDLNPNQDDCKEEGAEKPPSIKPLPGCDDGDDFCDMISDIPGDEDEAPEEEEEIADEILDGLVDGLEDEEIDLPLIDYGQLARLVGSGLAPRNVHAAGRGLALHNNLLVDAVFDRQPLRQFEELLVAEEVVEESVVEGAVADVEVADADVNGDEVVANEIEPEAVVVEFDGVSYADLQDDELDLSKSDGVSAWVKGFGGNSRADDSSILYNDYDLTAYGTSFGVDVALSEMFQIGAYANYGDLDVHHRSGDTGGGSWNPEGWGGGLTAQYSTRNFYVQGLLGASEFSGDQSRNILQITSDLGGNTAKGDKSVTSYLGALRVGAPFKTSGVLLEPQGQVVWSHNDEQGFSENHGIEKNLRLNYKNRTTNFVETQLGLKLSLPIRTGERALLVPSLRAAWLADWAMGNEAQEIGYKFTKKTVGFDSDLETQNGALIEAGLDYTIQNHTSIAWKIYGRGGVELWDSDRGATWRASGGVTFQF